MYKQVIVVRVDLKMGKGKIATQACHASVGAIKKANKTAVKRWERSGEKKVVLKIGSLKQLKSLCNRAKKMRFPCFLVKDAGLTQLKRGTTTCLGIGPAEEERIDRLTKKLKLL